MLLSDSRCAFLCVAEAGVPSTGSAVATPGRLVSLAKTRTVSDRGTYLSFFALCSTRLLQLPRRNGWRQRDRRPARPHRPGSSLEQQLRYGVPWGELVERWRRRNGRGL